MTPELYQRLITLAEDCKKTGRRGDLMVAGVLYTVLGTVDRMLRICGQYSQEALAVLKNEN